jgi:transcriptional regulator GlxA family with amidase domain
MSVRSPRSRIAVRLIEPVVWERIAYYRHLQKAVDYFEAHLAERTSATAVAAVACLEQTAFSKAFKRATGLTFRDFAEAVRLNRAVEEMVRSDQSLTQIALAAGFVSLTNLERAFQRRLGVSPSTYRKGLLAQKGFAVQNERGSRRPRYLTRCSRAEPCRRRAGRRPVGES